MSYLSNPAIWFATGTYLCVLALLILLLSLIERFRKFRRAGIVALLVGLIISIGAILLGDWSIPECYNSDGKFTADALKCIFP